MTVCVCQEECCLVRLIFITACANGVLMAPPVFLLLYLSVRFTHSASVQQTVIALLFQFPALYFQMNPVCTHHIYHTHLHVHTLCTPFIHAYTPSYPLVLPNATFIYLHRPLYATFKLPYASFRGLHATLETPSYNLHRPFIDLHTPFMHPS